AERRAVSSAARRGLTGPTCYHWGLLLQSVVTAHGHLASYFSKLHIDSFHGSGCGVAASIWFRRGKVTFWRRFRSRLRKEVDQVHKQFRVRNLRADSAGLKTA